VTGKEEEVLCGRKLQAGDCVPRNLLGDLKGIYYCTETAKEAVSRVRWLRRSSGRERELLQGRREKIEDGDVRVGGRSAKSEGGGRNICTRGEKVRIEGGCKST